MTLRAPGSLTSGEMDAVRLVGPSVPSTQRGRSGVLAASAGGVLYLVATSDGLIDYQGRPLGTDFSNVYTAGRMTLEGRAADAFDPRLEYARESWGASRTACSASFSPSS